VIQPDLSPLSRPPAVRSAEAACPLLGEAGGSFVRAARRAYRLPLLLTLGGQRIRLSVVTPYHTPAHRRWTPAPVALTGSLRWPPGADVRWRVAWARGSGEEIRAVVQGLLDHDGDALREELAGVYLGALAEGQLPGAAAESAATWLQSWMMAEDLGVDEVGFARVAAGLGGHGREVADLLRGASPVRPDEVRPGDLVVDPARVAVGVVERGPGPLLRAAPRRRRPGQTGDDPGALLELVIAHALPGGEGRLGPRRARLWLTRGEVSPLGDDEDVGFRVFYRPDRPAAVVADLTSACCPR
jgi:hypothetical protein